MKYWENAINISIKNIEKIKHHIKNLIYENKDFEGKDIKLIKEDC